VVSLVGHLVWDLCTDLYRSCIDRWPTGLGCDRITAVPRNMSSLRSWVDTVRRVESNPVLLRKLRRLLFACGCVENSEPLVPAWTGRKPVRWPRSEQRVNCSSVHGCVLVGCQSSRDQWGGCMGGRSTRAKHLTTPRPVCCLPTCVDVMIRVE